MGKLVCAAAMSHVLGTPKDIEEQAERVFQGMREIGRAIRDSSPDVLVVISSDHLNNFNLGDPKPLAIATAASLQPYGDMGIPTELIRGHSEFAVGFADFVARSNSGLTLAQVDDVRPDHGVMIPLAITDPQRSIPVVPLYINTVYSDSPTPTECWQLGKLLQQYVSKHRAAEERIAILACGGLSHWLGVPEEGHVNEDWDRNFMRQLLGEVPCRVNTLTNKEILSQAGNGGLEVNAWITLAAALPRLQGEVVFYEAIPLWASGMAGVQFTV
ncbi:aromatic ring-opening dioxygenase, catalytic LigB subunit family protein [Teredinibacter turnerae T7901]|uniref:Aromatic ring-opening dioxygenase, catalytic LigB subunit family protein n=1 Tax=Teredinibacter turnerae (strain ATCC 39867 / T7901) TaxID=377629 RepID=C5BRV0_TERTT|nr:protocatechuate 4,5-dioxygenase subunit beta [Teredinibacter turnerae]ACR11988.1 aromatic ring-opening dioxygenase, catalytic LigB subunit family protein [Teredinibacter turnerae T7901]